MIHQLLLGPQFIADPGQVQFTTTGDTNWVVPNGVTSICAVVVSGGGAGRCDGSGIDSGGAGGGLSYKNNIAVTPGETLVVRVGAGGLGSGFNQDGQAGGDSYIKRGATFLLGATGGGGGVKYDSGNVSYNTTAGYSSSQFIGGNNPYYDNASGGGNGGTSGRLTSNSFAGGGGGAGGYSGDGGRGGTNLLDPNNLFTNINEYALAGNGGGGGGGYYGTGAGGGGGGVGLIQEGSSGAAGTSVLLNKGGRGGSGGNNGNSGSATAPGAGGLYGGGGGGDDSDASNGAGAQGGARIIWGEGRSYPSNSANV